MDTSKPIQRVRIYLSERDNNAGQPLYMATLERLRSAGATGATVMRGIAGFGPGHRLRTSISGDPGADPPIVIEWIDRADRVARVLPTLDDLLPDALITIEELRVYRAALRSSGPFGERAVGEAAVQTVITATPGMLIDAALARLAEQPQPILPVLDERGHVIGLLADPARMVVLVAGETRGVLPVPTRLLRALDAEERLALLSGLATRPVLDVMGADLRTLVDVTPVMQAVNTLIEWGLEALPVIQREGKLLGIFGVEQALRVALESRGAADGPIRDAEPAPPVQLLMQGAVPAIDSTASVADALARLLASPDGFLVVVEHGQPIGVLDKVHLLEQLKPPLRQAWLEAIVRPASGLPELFRRSDQPVTTMALLPAPCLPALTPRDQAIRALIDRQLERMLVIDDSGRLLGLIARRGLLRALAQEGAV